MNRTAALVVAVVAVPWLGAVAQQRTYVRVPAAAKAAPPARVLRLNAVTVVPAEADSVRLRRGEFVAQRVAPEATRRDTSLGGSISWDLPIQLTGVDAEGDVLDVRPIIVVEGGGLHYRVGPGDFTGSVLLGLQSVGHPSGLHRLGRSVRVLITASAGTVEPAQVALDHTNLPFKRVRLAAPPAPPDTVRLHIRTDFDANEVSIPVAVLRPAVRVAATPKRIAGYGLEVATLVVMADAARPRRSPVVTLTADLGRVQPVQVALDSSGTATSSIRSSGRGRATVTARSQSLQPASETVEFVFPWAFLVASFIGGVVGGFIREGWAKWKNKERVGLWGFIAGVLLAALVGLVVVVAWAFGINLLDIQPVAGSGEALIALIAALGAIAGLSVIAKKWTAGPAGG